jgi:thioredoxin 1
MKNETLVTTDDRGLKKILGQKLPALVVLYDGDEKKDKPLIDALKREAKRHSDDCLIIRVDVSENPQTLAKYDHPELPALITLTPAFFGRKTKSRAEEVRPSDVRNHLAHLLQDKPLPQDKPKRSEQSTGVTVQPIAVSDRNFRKVVLKSKQPVLVDFWAAWCGPCQTIAPFVEQLADKYKGQIKVAKLDTENNQRVPAEYQIQSIPTFIIFEGGQPVGRITGASPGAIEGMIADVLIPE